METLKTDICIIGAGSAGLSIASIAAQLELNVILIEQAEMGGDCLNYGCIPSKALLAAGHIKHEINRGDDFGIKTKTTTVNFKDVHQHIRHVIETIAPNDSQQRFESLGVKVIRGTARFVNNSELQANNQRIIATKYVIATGSNAFVPPIKGIDKTPYLTNHTIFDLTTCPEHLIIVGGGPIGIEMAQAFNNLGAHITVIEGLSILNKDDPELVAPLREILNQQGIVLHEQSTVEQVMHQNGSIVIKAHANNELFEVTGSHLLIAVGRRANVSALNLEKAGVDFKTTGITVDKRLRTSNKRIYAAGDVIGSYQFTHMASYHASIIIQNILFKLPAKIKTRAVPWVTYTDPELAHVGLSENDAIKQGISHSVLKWNFSDIDRAVCEQKTIGLVKIIATKRGKILGVTILGPHAGELIQPWILAINNNLSLKAIANMIAPYPTFGEINKRVASSFYTPKLFSEFTKRIVRFLWRFTK